MSNPKAGSAVSQSLADLLPPSTPERGEPGRVERMKLRCSSPASAAPDSVW